MSKKKQTRSGKDKGYYATQTHRTRSNLERALKRHTAEHPSDSQAVKKLDRVKTDSYKKNKSNKKNRPRSYNIQLPEWLQVRLSRRLQSKTAAEVATA